MQALRNLCTRCGKQRIVVKTWTERIEKSLLTYTTTACPDEECQGMIDKELALQKKRRQEIEKSKEQRIAALRA